MAVEICEQAWWACMTRSDWAAWVQAIGSILAVGGAAAVAIYQERTQRRLETQRLRQAKVSDAEALAALFESLADQAKDVASRLGDWHLMVGDDRYREYQRTRVEDIVRIVRSVDLMERPPEVQRALLELNAVAQSMQYAVDGLMPQFPTGSITRHKELHSDVAYEAQRIGEVAVAVAQIHRQMVSTA